MSNDISLEPTFTGLSEQIALHGRFRSNKAALWEWDRRLDWKSYDETGNSIGHALADSGISPGDRIGMLVSNSIWAHELLLGIWRAGAVAVPLSPMLSGDAIQRMLVDAGAKMMFASKHFESLATGASAGQLPVVVDGDAFNSWLDRSRIEPLGIRNSADDLAVIIYSSGTTGTPKGIAHSHGARLSFAAGFAAEFRFHYETVALSAIPMYSNGAWLSWSPAKWFGACTAILPTFSPADFFAALQTYRPTHGFIVPAMAHAILAEPDIEDAGLQCFETAITAGSPMAESMKGRLQKLTGNALYELWGLTEGVATIISPADMPSHPNAVGRPILGCDIRIIDAEDRDVSFTSTGEIVGYSAGLMSGYWNRPNANTAILWQDDNNRTFIRTGDIGELDEDGFLTLRGRLKDMIISGGINVYPIDIESVLITHDQVLDAAVVGVDDEKWGEVPVAFARLDTDADAEIVLQWLNQQLAKHQRVRAIVSHPEDFPRNTLGKVLKDDLKQSYYAQLHQIDDHLR